MFDFNKKWLLLPFAIILVSIFLGAIITMRTVPSGYKGIKISWGKIIGDVDEGLHFINPFAGEDIVQVNVQIQAFTSEPQSTGTVDLQEVTTEVTVNYRIDPAFVEEIYRDLRDEYESRIIRPALEDGLKSTTAQFTSTQMIQERPTVRTTLFNLLKARIEPYHIILVEVSLTDFQFDPKFNEQLEATATAQKKVLEEEANLKIIELQQQQKVITAIAEANATLLKAQADAQAQIILAQAQTEAIQMLKEQLGEHYLEYLALLQWDGKLPYFYGSDVPIPFIGIAP